MLIVCGSKAYLTSAEENFGFTHLELVRVLDRKKGQLNKDKRVKKLTACLEIIYQT